MQFRSKPAMLAALAVATVGCVAAGCSSSSSTASTTPASQFGVNAKGTVVFYQRAATNAVALALVPKFNSTHPGLTVKIVQTSPNDDTSTLATAIRAGNPPDLVGLNDIDVPEFSSKSTLMDLSKYVQALPEFKDLSAGHLNLGKYQGKYYAVPYLADLSVLWYNKALFAKAGISSAPTSYASMVSDADAIQKLNLPGVHGFSFAGDCQGCLGFTMLPNLWADKNYLIEGDLPNQTINIKNNSKLTALLNAYHQIWANGDAPANDQTDNGATWGDDFATGKIGIFPGPYGKYPSFVSSGNIKDFGIAALPGESGGTGSTFDGGDDFVIPQGAKNASGAWEFVKWMLQQTQQTTFPKYGYTPVVTSTLTPSFAQANPYDAVALNALKTGYAPTTLIYDQAFNEPNSPWYQMFTASVYHGNVTSSQSTAQTAFEQLLTSTNSGK